MKLVDVKVKNKNRKILILNDEEKSKRAILKDKISNEIEFPKSVFSFIKGRHAKQAAQIVEDNIDNYKYFIKCDIENFYDSINIDILTKKLDSLIQDKSLVEEINEVLNAERETADIKGISQGSPLSPILSNIYLMDFDISFEVIEDIKYVRFCDDMMFLSNENILPEIQDKLSKLMLTLSKEKTFIGKAGDSVKFLGIDIEKPYDNTLYNNYDYISNIINNMDKDKFINSLNSIGKYNFNNDELEQVCKIITEKLGLEYYSMFKFIVLKRNKDELMEELIEKADYRAAYEFENLLMNLNYENAEYKNMLEIFKGRENEYYVSEVDGEKEYTRLEKNIEILDIEKHINGEKSIAIRLDREDGKSKILVFDIDSENEENALYAARNLKYETEQLGYFSYIEYSGMKGYHLWIFFNEFISIKDLNSLGEKIINNVEYEGVAIEIIPKYNNISETQNIIKLPLGIHPKTLKKCEFIDIDSIEQIKLNKFINYEYTENFLKEIEKLFLYCFKIIKNCSVIRYIIERGINKRKMCHFDRLLILYVFSHVQQGNKFIHYIMEQLDNYSYNITEKYINKAPDNPISCKKIRDYFKDTEIIINCNCSFVLDDKCYASPILHSGDEQFRKNSIENSIRTTIKELIQLKNQRDELDKKMHSLDSKLNSLFNSLESDELAIDIGNLKRIKEPGAAENKWIIEIKL